jgi:hypothetical protein
MINYFLTFDVGSKMKHLLHSFLSKSTDGSTFKYEIYSKYQGGDIIKIPEGTCQIVQSVFDVDSNLFKVAIST